MVGVQGKRQYKQVLVNLGHDVEEPQISYEKNGPSQSQIVSNAMVLTDNLSLTNSQATLIVHSSLEFDQVKFCFFKIVQKLQTGIF